MKKYIYTGLILIFVILAIVFSQNDEKGSIKIGFIAPLSGEAAVYGETEKNAVVMAVEEINANGGVDGREIEIIYEDGKCNGKDAVTAGQKLINIDKVKVILGGACSGETLAVAPIAEQNKVILFSAFSSNPTITNAGDYIFRNSPSDSDVGKLDATTISKMYKTVALVTENVEGAIGSYNIMIETFRQKGVGVKFDEKFGGQGASVTDFRDIITKIKLANPDVIYFNAGSGGKGAGLFIKQVRELGIQIPIHGNLALASKEASDVAGKYINGVIATNSSKLSSSGDDLRSKYVSKFGKEPAYDLEMAGSYDRVYIIKQAIESVGYNSTKIKDYLYNLDKYSGALGTYHFDQNGDVVGVGFSNYRIENGKQILVDEFKD